MSLKSYTQGLNAEILAILYLFFKGYRILNWRFKTSLGEIDILAEKRGALVCVEVKQRADIASALEAVTPAMRSRIARCAKAYVSQNPHYFNKSIRFDLIAISGLRIRHLDNAWPEPT